MTPNNLNSKQNEAALTTEGPVLILAGPGSGKTKTLTARIANLIQAGVPAENILAVTFTNKAAEEMKTRLAEQCGKSSGIFIGTFHSFSLRILRAHAPQIQFLPHFSIFDEDDSLGLIKEVMKERGVDPQKFPAGMMKSVISRLKNELKSPDSYREETGPGDPFSKTVYLMYAGYQKRLKDANAMDFDDLLVNACELLEKHPQILAAYQERFRYINVDEWQDTNFVQYTLIKMLAGKHQNLAVVGDDAQSIYSFRGADYRNIMEFEKDWPDAKVVILDQNYRSTQNILDAAREIIARNRLQKEKILWTEREGGAPLELAIVEDERREAAWIVENVKDLLKRGRGLSDMAVLYRTNAQSRVLEETLLRHNFPYALVGGVKFYQRKEVKDILAYVRYLLNRRDLLSLKRIINVPARGIGKKSFLKYISSPQPSWGQDSALGQFTHLIETLEAELHRRKITDFLKHLLKTLRYQEHLKDATANAEERWENVQELVSLAKKYDGMPPPAGAEKLLEDVALMSDADEIDEKENRIHLMTLHASKGLEFPIIFMVGMEEGVFPHSRAMFDPNELEEERRLCYVGLTRAKDRVFLSYALNRTRFGSVQANLPSRFLGEIPENLIEVRENGRGDILLD